MTVIKQLDVPEDLKQFISLEIPKIQTSKINLTNPHTETTFQHGDHTHPISMLKVLESDKK
jgi:hypothetical protein